MNLLSSITRFTVITSPQTLLGRKATGEKGPATELGPGTYTLSRSFSHMSYRSQLQILSLPTPYEPVVLLPVHKVMGDEGFATRTDSSCG